MQIRWNAGIWTILIMMLTLGTAGSATAGVISASQPWSKYGHDSNDQGRCAATSQINSFGFLANMYPATYAGTNLLSGDPASPLSPVVQLDNLMGGSGCGVTDTQAWNGKISWFSQYAANTSTFAAMTNGSTAGWMDAQVVTKGIPTASFLLTQIAEGEDVEIGLGGANHWVTLTGISVDSTTGLALAISYIDPNCVNGTDAANPGASTAAITNTASGMQFGWRNGNGLVCNPLGATINSTIEVAFAESPIPEPLSVLLFATGLFALIIVRRRVWM